MPTARETASLASCRGVAKLLTMAPFRFGGLTDCVMQSGQSAEAVQDLFRLRILASTLGCYPSELGSIPRDGAIL